MFEREIAEICQKRLNSYPGLLLHGPRQSGKTTMAKAIFPNLPYVSLENLDTLKFLASEKANAVNGFRF